MIVVIIAGGSGTRLWPLSQPNYPKHLLKLTDENSLLQNTFKRARQITDQIFVITEASHAGEVRLQLPEIPADNIIVEPGRRGTASCIVLALSLLARKYPDETVVFLHADHHITDTEGFNRTVKAAARASAEEKQITLIGLVPDYPATGFGYIKSGSEVGQIDGLSVREAIRFVEKPNYKLAEEYIKDGNYFWNLGLFAAPISVFVENLRQYAPDLSLAYEAMKAEEDWMKLDRLYLELPSQPIDTALMEKAERLLVIPGQFDWADIGSFFDLHKVLMDKDTNALKGEVYQLDCTDSMIHGSTKPVIAVGLEGVIVVDTPDGLLVCSKEQSQKVGDIVKKLQSGGSS